MRGVDEIATVLSEILGAGGSDPAELDNMFRMANVDPAAVAGMAHQFKNMMIAMNLDPEDAVVSAFNTGLLIGVKLGGETLSVGDMQPD